MVVNIRSLFQRKPRSVDDIDESKLADRPLDQAVSAFGPGSEIVKDGTVHAAIGFAEWVPGPVSPISRDPLGQPSYVAKCRQCQAIRKVDKTDVLATTCLACEHQTEVFPLYQPKGFRTDYGHGEDFDDELEQGQAASSPQIGTPLDKGAPIQVGRTRLRPLSQEDVFVVNDNYGLLYEMRRLQDQSVVVLDPTIYREPPQIPPNAGIPIDEKASIGAISKTDVLTIELKLDDLSDKLSPLGVISLSERYMLAGLAALTSFAHHLRVVAAHQLDIDPQELEVGIQPVAAPGINAYTGRIFLADSLENGAGYAPYIGTKEFFGKLLERLVAYGDERFNKDWHVTKCDTSCPDCLRSYENRRVHALLDWRLALDVSELAAGKGLSEARWFDRSNVLVAPVMESLKSGGVITCKFGELSAIVLPKTKKIALLAHPLWSVHRDYLNEKQATAVLEAIKKARELGAIAPDDAVGMWDLWTLARTPHRIIEWLSR